MYCVNDQLLYCYCISISGEFYIDVLIGNVHMLHFEAIDAVHVLLRVQQ